MRFFILALFSLLALFFASHVQARLNTYYFTGGDWMCDMRDCTNTIFDASFNYGFFDNYGDGNQWLAPVRLINGQYPGPTVEVFEGEDVVVHYENLLILELPTSLHWHGMFQRGTDFMDGVVWVSQCPIEINEVFTYRFQAYPAGSHWYHSHANIEAIEGIAGLLIVHRPNDPLNMLHNIGVGGSGFLADPDPTDFNPPARAELIFAVTNLWRSTRVMHMTQYGEHKTLLNGKWSDGSAQFPNQVFDVVSDHCYRIRNMFLEASDNAQSVIEFSIDNHDQTVIALDGIPNDPVVASKVDVLFAQRVDTVFCPKKGKARYYARFRPLHGNNPYRTTTYLPDFSPEFVAEIRVDGADDTTAFAPVVASTAPVHDQIYGDWSMMTLTFANLPAGLPDGFLDHIGFEGVTKVPDATHQLHLRLGYSTFAAPAAQLGFEMFMYNNKAWHFPKTPLTISEDCADEQTWNTEVPYDAVLEIIFQNTFSAIHPLHLHGGAMWALGSSSSVGDAAFAFETIDQAKCDKLTWSDFAFSTTDWACAFDEAEHRSKLNVMNPPVRDTVALPAHGWTVIRWRTNNPGYWFFHCHTEGHMGAGMLHVFTVAPEMREKTPDDFPQCGPCRTDGNRLANPLEDSAPAKLTAAGIAKFGEKPTNSKTEINVTCKNEHTSGNGGSSGKRGDVNVNFKEMFNGMNKRS